MTLYPEVQRRAQKELDQVVGRGRFPNFSDRDDLPYVSNVVKESLRWKSVTPLGNSHVRRKGSWDAKPPSRRPACYNGRRRVPGRVHSQGYHRPGQHLVGARVLRIPRKGLDVMRRQILHDDAVYAKPDEFNPDRYLPTARNPEGEPNPTRAAFGFGRR